jgi:hypothetical protein
MLLQNCQNTGKCCQAYHKCLGSSLEAVFAVKSLFVWRPCPPRSAACCRHAVIANGQWARLSLQLLWGRPLLLSGLTRCLRLLRSASWQQALAVVGTQVLANQTSWTPQRTREVTSLAAVGAAAGGGAMRAGSATMAVGRASGDNAVGDSLPALIGVLLVLAILGSAAVTDNVFSRLQPLGGPSRDSCCRNSC